MGNIYNLKESETSTKFKIELAQFNYQSYSLSATTHVPEKNKLTENIL